MGWRGRGGGWSGRWPGRGPFSNLPPWRRPGWIYGYGRGGYVPSAYGYRSYSPYSCARFPWLPRWWWANPDYASQIPYPQPVDPNAEVPAGQVPPPGGYAPWGFPAMAPEQEKKYLEQQLDWVSKEMESIKKRLDELGEEK